MPSRPRNGVRPEEFAEATDHGMDRRARRAAQGDVDDKLGGTTRNAVIGKANRLGLSKPTKSAITRKQKREAARPPVVEIPGPGATLLSLTSTTCRWPQGHPGEPGFAFCGARSVAGQPYCAYHASVAYQTPSKDRKQQRA